MTRPELCLSSIEDHVDLDDHEAWVQFEYRGRQVRWDLEVSDDWLDPDILSKCDALLADSGSSLRLYGNFSDYGQVAFLGAFTADDRKTFVRLTGIKMEPLDE